MKEILFGIAVFVSVASFAQEEEENYRWIDTQFEFEKGSKELLYGDKVVLRKKADKESTAIDTLAIGTEITILEKSDKTIEVNGLESNWYKVKYKGKTGYIVGGWIALDHKEVGSDVYLVIYAAGSEEYYRKIRCRVLRRDGEFYGHEVTTTTSTFHLKAYGSRGVTGIENMACIDLLAEACGVDGGEVYLFNDGKRLIEAITLTSVSDGGVFWFHESVEFPEDNYWGDNTLVYEREFGEFVDEELQMTRAVTHRLPIVWENGAFNPNPEELKFDEEEEE